jgi:endoglucanase
MTGGAPDYILSPLFLKFLDFAVEWAEKYGLYLIIDNHSFHPVNPLADDIDVILIPVWAQIARRYSNRPYVVYEILNEPHGISDKRWGEVQGMAIDEIRKYDRNTPIIIGGTDYNSYSKLSAIPDYSDPNLIYTFHFYDPFLFTHQGASWTPPLEYLSGVPFPADRLRMPRIPARLRGTWVEDSLRYNYQIDSSPSKLFGVLDSVVAFSRERNVPVFCGEYGVYMRSSPPDDRVVWYEIITKALDKRNIPRTSWDYYGGFGIFNTDSRGDFYLDVNTAVVRALGFTPPVQAQRIAEPFKTGFTVFDDYANREIYAGFWGDDDADFSFYETNAAEGEFAIRWDNAGLYNAFFFAFRLNGDFSELVNAGYCLEFLARAENPVSFAVRFLNPESPSSNPWRMSYTIDENILPPDGRWHTIRIPLTEMREQGAWVNLDQTWHNPQGEFSWQNIERLEFAAEHMDLKGKRIFFDSIKITEP